MPVRMAGHGACYRYCPAGFGTFETYAVEPNTQWIVACHNSPLLGERRMYALATIPLIKKLKCHSKQIWYADDAAAIGKLADLRAWWDHLTREGPDFGYYPNPSKTWLVTKEGCEAAGFSTFAGTGVNVTQDGRPYLGAAVGSTEYVEKFVKSKVSSWLSSVCNLTAIARTQPHAAYSALTHGLSSKWTYLCRTVPNISNLLKPLDDILQTKLIPALTGKSPPRVCLVRSASTNRWVRNSHPFPASRPGTPIISNGNLCTPRPHYTAERGLWTRGHCQAIGI